jgi:hypothetical protein
MGRWGRAAGLLGRLRAEVEQNQLASERLYEAVERGLLPMEGTLTKRAHELQARRQALLADIAGVERERQFPMELLSSRHVERFCQALRAKMLDPGSDFGRRYRRPLVKEIRVGTVGADAGKLCGPRPGHGYKECGDRRKGAQIWAGMAPQAGRIWALGGKRIVGVNRSDRTGAQAFLACPWSGARC